MDKDGGWEELFSPLADDSGEGGSEPEATQGDSESESPVIIPDLPDPVIEATPLTPFEPAQPPAVPPIVSAPPLTRRELRERLRGVDDTAGSAPAGEDLPKTEPFTPIVVPPPVPVGSAVPWEPAPGLAPAPEQPADDGSAEGVASVVDPFAAPVPAAAFEPAPADPVIPVERGDHDTVEVRPLPDTEEPVAPSQADEPAAVADTVEAPTVPAAFIAAQAQAGSVPPPSQPIDPVPPIQPVAPTSAPAAGPVQPAAPMQPATPVGTPQQPVFQTEVPRSAPPPAAPAEDSLAALIQPRQAATGGFPMQLEPPSGGGRRRSLRWLGWFIPLLLILGGIAGAAWWVWTNYEDKVREIMGWELPNDYVGTGNGEEVIITIRPGEIGSTIAANLHQAGVTMTYDAFYDLLVEIEESTGSPVNFATGNYTLQKEMSAQAAFDALMDPANRVTNLLMIPEGSVLPDTLGLIAATTGIDYQELEALAHDPAHFGIEADVPTVDGYLFPATYELDGSETAESILQRLIDEMYSRLDALGVAPESRHHFITFGSIVQRESGPVSSTPGCEENPMGCVARVFKNRLDEGWHLESDATVAYGTGNLHTVWTTEAERNDASNPYNTYANPGLPIGPIGAPSEAALRAAINPTEGPWFYFVPVNLATGETVFTETIEGHEAAVEQLREWCAASPENDAYCD